MKEDRPLIGLLVGLTLVSAVILAAHTHGFPQKVATALDLGEEDEGDEL